MTAPIMALPKTGRYHVDTLHSHYLIDCDNNTATRQPMHDEAVELTADDTPFKYDAILCVPGMPMLIESTEMPPYGLNAVRQTTRVLGITAVTS